MQGEVIKKSEQPTNKWSGGTTTQLFIYPPGSNYQKRDFLFRISTATVEVDRSDFTSLPGFKRKLIVLYGELTIHHKDHYSKHLKKFEQDEFDGGWITSAEGKVTDFNLMMASGVEGDIEAIVLEKDQKTPLEMGRFSFVYVFRGAIAANGQRAGQGDLLSIDDYVELTLIALERAELIICSVRTETQSA